MLSREGNSPNKTEGPEGPKSQKGPEGFEGNGPITRSIPSIHMGDSRTRRAAELVALTTEQDDLLEEEMTLGNKKGATERRRPSK